MSNVILNAVQPWLRGATPAPWYPACPINYTRDTWVKLLHRPNEYADDEAKLLCPAADNTWVAWVPNHGEIVLDRSLFHC